MNVYTAHSNAYVLVLGCLVTRLRLRIPTTCYHCYYYMPKPKNTENICIISLYIPLADRNTLTACCHQLQAV